MKKKVIIVVAIFLLFVIGLMIYPVAKKNTVKENTIAYVVSQGYPVESINGVEVLHSYANKFLGFNEWRINVEFEKEPNILFWFTYRDKQIIYQGVSSDPMMDKEDVIAYSEKFKSGTLLDNPYNNWFLFEDYISTPIEGPIVLDKQQSVMLKYKYPTDIDYTGLYLIAKPDSCINVSFFGIDGIYSNNYMVMAVSGVYKGNASIKVVDENDNVIDELPIEVTNNTLVKTETNVNEVIENGYISVQDAKDWIKKGLQEIFNNEKRTLVFEGYSWYIRKQ